MHGGFACVLSEPAGKGGLRGETDSAGDLFAGVSFVEEEGFGAFEAALAHVFVRRAADGSFEAAGELAGREVRSGCHLFEGGRLGGVLFDETERGLDGGVGFFGCGHGCAGFVISDPGAEDDGGIGDPGGNGGTNGAYISAETVDGFGEARWFGDAGEYCGPRPGSGSGPCGGHGEFDDNHLGGGGGGAKFIAVAVAGIGGHEGGAGDADPDAGGHGASGAAAENNELETFAVGVGLDVNGSGESACDDIDDGVFVAKEPGTGVEDGLLGWHGRDGAGSFHEVIRSHGATPYYAEQDVLCPDPAILFSGCGRGCRVGLFSRQETQAHDSD